MGSGKENIKINRQSNTQIRGVPEKQTEKTEIRKLSKSNAENLLKHKSPDCF